MADTLESVLLPKAFQTTGERFDFGLGVVGLTILRSDRSRIGMIIQHPLTSGGGRTRCVGTIWFGDGPAGKPKWTIESLSPLTISPSVLCHCGFHGFIQAGKWVSA